MTENTLNNPYKYDYVPDILMQFLVVLYRLVNRIGIVQII